MKVLLFGKNANTLEKLAKSYGLEPVSHHPDLILTYGGDGTLLASERLFPSIPKFPIRDSKVCNKCPKHETDVLLNLLLTKKLPLKTQPKLEAIFENERFLALNDIVIRNQTPIHAIRFILKINSEITKPELIIGDGIVVSTAFGSTGYFQSVTKESFDQNFKIAFSNTTQIIKSLEFKAGDGIEVEIVRGPAVLSLDNNPHLLTLKEKDTVKLLVSNQIAKIYNPETLRCKNCQIKRGLRLTNL